MFSPCASRNLGGAGTSYPINFFEVNPFTAGSSLNYLDAMGHSNYHSLQAVFRQRLNHGMEFDANYTLSHSLVEGPVNGYQANAGGSFQTDRNFRLSYRPSSYDIRNIFHLSGTYDLPFGKGKIGSDNMLVKAIAGGWTLSWLGSYYSGTPLSVTSSTCSSSYNPGAGQCMPNLNPNFTGKTIRQNGSWGKGIVNGTLGVAPSSGGIGYLLGGLYDIRQQQENFSLCASAVKNPRDQWPRAAKSSEAEFMQ